jgi:hypothetical protein
MIVVKQRDNFTFFILYHTVLKKCQTGSRLAEEHFQSESRLASSDIRVDIPDLMKD